MLEIDPVAARAIQPELASDETLIWAGRPSRRPIFRRQDLFLVPFSLIFGGFAVFYEGSVTGLWGPGPKANAPNAPWAYGIPLAVWGQYLIWGRFINTARKKQRTFYAVTDRRVIVVRDGASRKMASAYIDTLPTLIKEGSGAAGTIRFSQPEHPDWNAWDPMAIRTIPVFTDVDDVEGLCRLIAELRQRDSRNRALKA